MNSYLFVILGLIFGTVFFTTRNILLFALFLLGAAIYLLFLGVVSLNKRWYEKYLIFSNKLKGIETDINPLTFQGIKIGAIIYLFVGLIILGISLLLIFIYPIQRNF